MLGFRKSKVKEKIPFVNIFYKLMKGDEVGKDWHMAINLKSLFSSLFSCYNVTPIKEIIKIVH